MVGIARLWIEGRNSALISTAIGGLAESIISVLTIRPSRLMKPARSFEFDVAAFEDLRWWIEQEA